MTQNKRQKKLTNISAPVAAIVVGDTERQRARWADLDAVLPQSLSVLGGGQPVGGQQAQYHQQVHEHIADQCDHLRGTETINKCLLLAQV